MSSFEDGIRKWVKLDDELRAVQERAREIREKRNNIASGLHDYVNQNDKLQRATINISDGRLRFVNTQTPQALTFKFLEESLNEIIANKDTVQQILTHIKNKRTMKISSDIKRYYSDN